MSLQGVRVYAVQCKNEPGAEVFWRELADKTGGKHLQLDEFRTIVDIIMAICYREMGAMPLQVIINLHISNE